jgi:predicted aspartyl protease
VRLDSVALGKARVADVPATINPHLPVGLLGAAYLNHFVYSVDPASGELLLSRRDA